MLDNSFTYLNQINSPDDLKKFKPGELIRVCNELRKYIIDVISDNPGHFGASLGVIELTTALHYVYNTPNDKIIWDVGHQAYAHKILTGRRDVFHTNRKYKGISGFPKRDESIYDAFGVGHSSTSISAALGIAVAAKEKGEDDKQVVAVIGDGALTGGMAFEGLNNAGIEKTNLLVILNDNNMAIDPNVGALKEYLLDITTSRTFNKIRDEIWNVLGKFKKYGTNTQQFLSSMESSLKSILFDNSNLFEAFNFRYFGPVDGHDVIYLTKILEDMKGIPGPKLLHCITKKGKGYSFAEESQTKWHAPGKFNKETGEIFIKKQDKLQPLKFNEVFGKSLLELAQKNEKIVGITPAMPSGSSLNIMMDAMPNRVFDVGIAEQHAVTFSAGLATEGFIPFCVIYSSFMQRAYDQIIHDVALQKLNVVLCFDRAGLVGGDGATHHGAFDMAFLRPIPNIIIASPLNESDFRNLMYTAQLPNMGPFAIRYPKAVGEMTNWQTPFKKVSIGKGSMITDGDDIAILSIGPIGNRVLEACEILDNEGISVALYDMHFLKPIDKDILHYVFGHFKHIITIEDGAIVGGLGSAVLEFMSNNKYSSEVIRLGIPDYFVQHGSQEELFKECGFDLGGIVSSVKRAIKKQVMSKVS